MKPVAMNLVRSSNRPDTLVMDLETSFLLSVETPTAVDIISRMKAFSGIRHLQFHTEKTFRWDSALVALATGLQQHCVARNITLDTTGLPRGVQKLLALSTAGNNAPASTPKTKIQKNFFHKTGSATLRNLNAASSLSGFIGEVVRALFDLLRGRTRMRAPLFFSILKTCTSDALPIVSLISCLVGLILAFVGAVQLVMFGAQIYVASLVGIAMVRVMGAVMAGVIMAGRTGAAFAAQLGTMESNEEIDALRTLGIDPTGFLVIPRMLALTIALPLLCIYADLMGILGGLLVGVFMLDLNPVEYLTMTRASVSLGSFWIGVFQSMVFGILVALAGCYKGMQCGRSASAVGNAATGAVVSGIVAIVVATAVITVLCNILGI